jgi:hypothetical protein
MKRFIIALLGMLVSVAVIPALGQSGVKVKPVGPATTASEDAAAPVLHRYLIERTFPAGALAGLDQKTKNAVNATNSKFHVKWIESYATADKNKTFCIYEGPSEKAIRDAATANGLPVDLVFAVPVTLMPHGADVVTR